MIYNNCSDNATSAFHIHLGMNYLPNPNKGQQIMGSLTFININYYLWNPHFMWVKQ